MGRSIRTILSVMAARFLSLVMRAISSFVSFT
jgi:hypothetical protein